MVTRWLHRWPIDSAIGLGDTTLSALPPSPLPSLYPPRLSPPQDDVKLWLAKSELRSWVESVQKQQQHFSELPDQLQLDPAVLITFTKVQGSHM